MVAGLMAHSPRMVEEHVGQVLAAAEGFYTWGFDGRKIMELKKQSAKLQDRPPERFKPQLRQVVINESIGVCSPDPTRPMAGPRNASHS